MSKIKLRNDWYLRELEDTNDNETLAGVKLTSHEKSCIKLLRKLQNKWYEKPNRLWLWSASGLLYVMLSGGDNKVVHASDNFDNPVPEMGNGLLETSGLSPGVNRANVVSSIDIPNDGGDW